MSGHWDIEVVVAAKAGLKMAIMQCSYMVYNSCAELQQRLGLAKEHDDICRDVSIKIEDLEHAKWFYKDF